MLFRSTEQTQENPTPVTQTQENPAHEAQEDSEAKAAEQQDQEATADKHTTNKEPPHWKQKKNYTPSPSPTTTLKHIHSTTHLPAQGSMKQNINHVA